MKGVEVEVPRYVEPSTALGRLIRDLRLAQIGSQEKLAEKTGVPRATLSDLEQRETGQKIDVAALSRVAAALEKPVALFWEAAGEEFGLRGVRFGDLTAAQQAQWERIMSQAPSAAELEMLASMLESAREKMRALEDATEAPQQDADTGPQAPQG